MEPLDADEIARYQRHILLPEVGGAGQQKLKAARVLVIGAGGLGSAARPVQGKIRVESSPPGARSWKAGRAWDLPAGCEAPPGRLHRTPLERKRDPE